MAISIDWGTRVIFVPKADLTPLGGNLYELDVDWFRLTLKDLEDDPEGMPHPDTHNHITESTLAGTTFARQVEIINGYTVEFEDDGTPAGHYVVACTGANHNLADVKVPNGTSLIINNSAGLIVNETGVSGLTPTEAAALLLIEKMLRNKLVTDPATGVMTLYDDDGSPLLTADIFEDAAGTTPYGTNPGSAAERRERME